MSKSTNDRNLCAKSRRRHFESTEEQSNHSVKPYDTTAHAVFICRRVRKLSEFSSQWWCRWTSMVLMGLAFLSMLAKFALLNMFPELRVIEKIGLIRPSLLEKFSQTLDIWTPPESYNYYQCINRAKKELLNGTTTNGYLLVRSNGGLNQMKLGFADVKPCLKNPVSWSKSSYYRLQMVTLLKKHKVVKFTLTNSRLANNVGSSIQRLRCRTLYKALKFATEIEDFGMNLVDRLKNNGSKYIALHLRYEKDMLSFKGCSHNLTKHEDKELKRKRGQTLHWKNKKIYGMEQRLLGRCPMTPREVTLFLEAIGFPSDTKIYIVSGEIYGQDGLTSLQAKYPNLFFHSNLASEDELQPCKDKLNQLAALDYIIAVESDIFIYSYEGNMA
ncbi:hypothetical protein C1H46_025022 [Malus baccata]|uniref:O-fucosyltransferase family protein n=1 Tax=Malus baccata TaxID=106549 RepID=A0A540LSU7_MALBA|nr:hypothetical protein C1H46_025022 [Malus baccata]